MRHDTLYNRILPRLMAMVLVLTMMLSAAPAVSAAQYEGTCGRDLQWSFDMGTLTITGSGAMEDYTDPAEVPWHAFREDIFRVELPDGLTRVGSLAFSGCRNLTAVTIPGTVRQIGAQAFRECTGLVILRLPEGLECIEENAFDQCTSLQDLRLPGTLKELQWQAFYRCYSLRTVEIPYSVEEMGAGVFSYCYGLIKAVIYAPLEDLPRWTFYGCNSLTIIELPAQTTGIGHYGVRGCENLEVVYYGGEPGDAEELKDQISRENEGFAENGTIVDEIPDGTGTTDREVTDENGDTIRESTTVTDTGDTTITVTEKENMSDPDAETPPTEISATIVEEEGWEEVEDAIRDALQDSGSVEAEIYLPIDTKIPDELVEKLAGRDVILTVIGTDGSKYTLDFNQIDRQIKIEGLDLSYRLAELDKTYEELAGAAGYRLYFNKSCTINASVMIRLPSENARKTITLYQVEGGKLRKLQSVVADANAVAQFYLGAVDSGTDYVLGINVAAISQTELLIPESLEEEFDVTERLAKVDYVVTGRYSKWGLTSGQVTRLMITFMLGSAVFVGLLMYVLNKRKLRRGYTPGWDDEDDETE